MQVLVSQICKQGILKHRMEVFKRFSNAVMKKLDRCGQVGWNAESQSLIRRIKVYSKTGLLHHTSFCIVHNMF